MDQIQNSFLSKQNIVNPVTGEQFFPAELINPQGDFPLLLVCEHASDNIPSELNDLGVSPETRKSHAVYDIGAKEVAIKISRILNCPLIISNVSRIVIDCNRDPYSPAAIPAKSEVHFIPGNKFITREEHHRRVEAYFNPFHGLVEEYLNNNPWIKSFIAIHSFTPVFYGVDRHVDLGVLFEGENKLAEYLLQMLIEIDAFRVVPNEPYKPDPKVVHTVKRHAAARNLPHLMVEIRNSLIRTETNQQRMGRLLAKSIRKSVEMVCKQMNSA
ncbi:MAG: N-formylglutamate amidohydrolase [Rhodobacteraceae bacterium]|nr:N-formylglutamate amidohydrolase [Paracoccaceae bacterium]